MLSKDLTPNPKAVNIIRPFNNRQEQPQIQQQLSLQPSLNYSTSTDSSFCTFSTASTTTSVNALHNYNNPSPMIRQPSAESNPGLSFFCHGPNSNAFNKSFESNKVFLQTKKDTSSANNTADHATSNTNTFIKESLQPLVISRVNLSNFQQRRFAATPALLTKDDLQKKSVDEDTVTIDDDDIKETDFKKKEEEIYSNRLITSFTPGFGILGAGLGSFMLRGNLGQMKSVPPGPPSQPKQADEARVNRKIEDLEIEKKSLLTLNNTLETVVKEQSSTISDLQNRLAAIERPLTPGLDTSTSKNGIMSSADIILEPSDLERYWEDEDAAYERIRVMLLGLIEQAQSAVAQNKRNMVITSGRVLTEYEAFPRILKRNDPTNNNTSLNGGRSRSLVNAIVDDSKRGSSKRRASIHGSINNNSASPQSISSTTTTTKTEKTTTTITTQLSSNNSNTNMDNKSPSTSPVPNRRYSTLHKSVSRSSISSIGSNISNSSRASKHSTKHKQQQILQDSASTKWLN